MSLTDCKVSRVVLGDVLVFFKLLNKDGPTCSIFSDCCGLCTGQDKVLTKHRHIRTRITEFFRFTFFIGHCLSHNLPLRTVRQPQQGSERRHVICASL